MVGVALEGECCGGVSREGLEVPDGLTALGEQAKAGVLQVMEPNGRETSRPSSWRIRIFLR